MMNWIENGETKIPFQTPYAKAWAEFKESSSYQSLVKTMQDKGFNHPYLDNILRTAFDAGWNNNIW